MAEGVFWGGVKLRTIMNISVLFTVRGLRTCVPQAVLRLQPGLCVFQHKLSRRHDLEFSSQIFISFFDPKSIPISNPSPNPPSISCRWIIFPTISCHVVQNLLPYLPPLFFSKWRFHFLGGRGAASSWIRDNFFFSTP